MRQETINLYKFDELTEEIKQTVIEKNRHINVDHCGWDDCVLDEWYLRLKNLGFEDVKILYSGFGSQGDGACFVGKADIEKYLTAHKLKTKFKRVLQNADYISISITHSWRYYFASSTDVNIEYYEDDPKVEALLNELQKIIKSERETIGNEIYRELDSEYFALIGDEAVAETVRINEHDFFEDGSRFVSFRKGGN